MPLVTARLAGPAIPPPTATLWLSSTAATTPPNTSTSTSARSRWAKPWTNARSSAAWAPPAMPPAPISTTNSWWAASTPTRARSSCPRPSPSASGKWPALWSKPRLWSPSSPASSPSKWPHCPQRASNARMSAPLLYIGLMSGTSMDGVDAVLLTMEGATPKVVGHASSAIPHRLRENLHALSHPGSDTIDLMGQADIAVAEVFAEAALQLLAGHNLTPADITALGSHGQTIRHRPRAGHGGDHFTVQIGDPNTIAALTGITTVADFRRKDM